MERNGINESEGAKGDEGSVVVFHVYRKKTGENDKET
jgi:hypothetical protein